jgi:hypothetical protein
MSRADGRDNWYTSTYTGANNDCVEVSPGRPVLVRDTKDRPGPVLALPLAAWREFAASLKG